jgi:3-hydroxyisobutyrate dehydrogenase-like beta-hydroxyacid dehydrogenase
MLEKGIPVTGWKLVPKRATRQWVDEELAKVALFKHLKESDVVETSLISPAKAETLLKKQRIPLPNDLVIAISSGSTLATEDDPRPAVLNIGKQLTAALGKLGE